MASTETPPLPVLGEQGGPCRACGAPLAEDQRYCLNCGQRRAGHRVDYESLLEARATAAPQAKRQLGASALRAGGIPAGRGARNRRPRPDAAPRCADRQGGLRGELVAGAGGPGGRWLGCRHCQHDGRGRRLQDVADTGTFSATGRRASRATRWSWGHCRRPGPARRRRCPEEQAETRAPRRRGSRLGQVREPAGREVRDLLGRLRQQARGREGALEAEEELPLSDRRQGVSQSTGGGGAAAASGPTTNSVNDLTSQAARNAKQPVQASDKALNSSTASRARRMRTRSRSCPIRSRPRARRRRSTRTSRRAAAAERSRSAADGGIRADGEEASASGRGARQGRRCRRRPNRRPRHRHPPLRLCRRRSCGSAARPLRGSSPNFSGISAAWPTRWPAGTTSGSTS